MILSFYRQEFNKAENQVVQVLTCQTSSHNILSFHVQRDMTGKNSAVILLNENVLSDEYVGKLLQSKLVMFSLNSIDYVQAISSIEEQGRTITITCVDFLTYIFNNMIPMSYMYSNPASAYTMPDDDTIPNGFTYLPYVQLTADDVSALNSVREFLKKSHTLNDLITLCFSYTAGQSSGNIIPSANSPKLLTWSYTSDELPKMKVDNKYFKEILNIGTTKDQDTDTKPETISDIFSELSNDNKTLSYIPQYNLEYKPYGILIKFSIEIDYGDNNYEFMSDADYASLIDKGVPRINGRDVTSLNIKVDYSHVVSNVASSGKIAQDGNDVTSDDLSDNGTDADTKYYNGLDDPNPNNPTDEYLIPIARNILSGFNSDNMTIEIGNTIIGNKTRAPMAVLNPSKMTAADFAMLSSRYGLTNTVLQKKEKADIANEIDNPVMAYNDEDYTHNFANDTLLVNEYWHNLPLLEYSKSWKRKREDNPTKTEDVSITGYLYHIPQAILPIPIINGVKRVLSEKYLTLVKKEVQKVYNTIPTGKQAHRTYLARLTHCAENILKQIDTQDPDYVLILPKDEVLDSDSTDDNEVPDYIIAKKSDLVKQVNINLNNAIGEAENTQENDLGTISNMRYYSNDNVRDSHDKTFNTRTIGNTVSDRGKPVDYTPAFFLSDTNGVVQSPTTFYDAGNVTDEADFLNKVQGYADLHTYPIITVQATINSKALFTNVNGKNIAQPGYFVGFAVNSKLFKVHTLYTKIKSIDYNMLNLSLSTAELASVDYFSNVENNTGDD